MQTVENIWISLTTTRIKRDKDYVILKPTNSKIKYGSYYKYYHYYHIHYYYFLLFISLLSSPLLYLI